jgi:hypothetical protein
VRSSTSPVRESRAAWVESSDVMPRPMIRLPLVVEELDALREPLERDEPDALRALLLLLLLLFDLLPELRDPLLELPFPPLALIPPLLRFGMLILW